MDTYFVDNFYHLSGCPKMEDALMTEARKQFMYHLVYEESFNAMVREIKHWQERLLKENPRWRPCEISMKKNSLVPGHVSLYINNSSLTLIRIEGEF